MDFSKQERQNFALINNIPNEYHSSDLRNFFSQFIESGGFDCFHFRHRPETIKEPEKNESNKNSLTGKSEKTTCCVVKLKSGKLSQFLKMYNRKHWVDKSGEIMKQVCYISRVKTPANEDADQQLKTRGEQKQIPSDREDFTMSDLNSLPELNPPDLMPNGNVGTPTMIFMDYIKQCRLPPKIIKKLGLSFPKTRTNKQYGSVPFDYGGDLMPAETDNCDNDYDDVLTGSGHEIVSEKVPPSVKDSSEICDRTNQGSNSLGPCPSTSSGEVNPSQSASGKDGKKRRKKKNAWRDEEANERMKLNIEENMIAKSDNDSEHDNDSCEEWERHEALYDDPANQERNKERLFEEPIELKWEKGGSGLVFYTDAQYWQAQEGDFDEQTADDWDVDMSGYYEEGAGDKDARDYLTMRQEKRRRDGIEQTDRFTAGIARKKKKVEKERADNTTDKIGKFEVHTKGIGRKILETQGWKEGEGLGSTITGIKDALENDGKKPKDKRGLGYYGEKLNRTPQIAERKVIISTVYDNPTSTDPNEELTRRNQPYHLKYRDEVLFSKSNTILFHNDD